MDMTGNAVRAYNPPQPQTEGSTLLGEITGGIAEAAARAYGLANRLREFNDGVSGSQPQAVGSGGLEKVKPGMTRAESLRNEVRSLHEALGLLDAEVRRLDRI